MTSITWVIPTWLTFVITGFFVVDIALSLYRIKWEHRLEKAKREAKDAEVRAALSPTTAETGDES